jgi:hypothetical protein
LRDIRQEDLLDVLACEIEARPDAPTIFQVAPLAQTIERRDGALAVGFPLEARRLVESFAAAERLCCTGIGWEVTAGPQVTLRISANDPALDVLESMWKTIHIEEVQ